MTTKVHASAVTTPMTILNRIQPPIRARATTSALRVVERRASLMPPIVARGLRGPLEQMRRPRRRVAVKPRKRLRAHHPAGPEDREAERAQAAQEPPRERGGEHRQPVRLDRLRHAVEGAEHDRDEA